MATLHVRNIPDDLYARLRRSAEASSRSIRAELAALMDGVLPSERFRRRQAAILSDLKTCCLKTRTKGVLEEQRKVYRFQGTHKDDFSCARGMQHKDLGEYAAKRPDKEPDALYVYLIKLEPLDKDTAWTEAPRR